MTPDQVHLVKSTWAQVLPIQDQAAELFYGRLFEIDPELKALFSGNMQEQGRKLMATINTAVNSINKLDVLLPIIQDLGRRHIGYGVKDKDYDSVGAALLWTLEQGLGDAFTAEVKEAWTLTYNTIAKVMMDAANETAEA